MDPALYRHVGVKCLVCRERERERERDSQGCLVYNTISLGSIKFLYTAQGTHKTFGCFWRSISFRVLRDRDKAKTGWQRIPLGLKGGGVIACFYQNDCDTTNQLKMFQS